MNILNIFQRLTRNPVADRQRAYNERLQQYARFLRAYQGYSVRGVLNTNIVRDWKRVKFNFTQPVVNLSAGWFAAKPLAWDIDNNPEATAAAHAIWDRSGSDQALLENALCCGIYGDLVGLATQDADGKPKIEFVDPNIASPIFDGSDYMKLQSLEIAYEEPTTDGEIVTRREMWGPGGMEAFRNDQAVEGRSYDILPACWIRNSSVKGLPFGLSDVEPILDLVEEYDHISSKQTRIVDMYASPNIVFEGIQQGNVVKQVGTTFHLPSGAKAYFLEWMGNVPAVEDQLTRIRNAIAEISQVPAVAFGQADSGLTSISGIAIQILYGPLISKTHRKQACWGPALQYLMWLCLRASGYKSLPLEAVNVQFPTATPVDGQAIVAEASAKVAAKLSSRRTVMSDLGVENPDSELKRIVLEEKVLQLAQPAPVIEQDANNAAKAGAMGRFSAETPEGIGANKPMAPSAPLAGGTGSTQTGVVDDVATLLQQMDALLEAENANIEAAEQTTSGPEAKV